MQTSHLWQCHKDPGGGVSGSGGGGRNASACGGVHLNDRESHVCAHATKQLHHLAKPVHVALVGLLSRLHETVCMPVPGCEPVAHPASFFKHPLKVLLLLRHQTFPCAAMCQELLCGHATVTNCICK